MPAESAHACGQTRPDLPPPRGPAAGRRAVPVEGRADMPSEPEAPAEPPWQNDECRSFACVMHVFDLDAYHVVGFRNAHKNTHRHRVSRSRLLKTSD